MFKQFIYGLAIAAFLGGGTIDACDVHDWAAAPNRASVVVPKNLAALQLQIGDGFRVVRRGVFLFASDLEAEPFDYVVNSILVYCQSALERSFFATRPTQPITVYIFKDKDSYNDGVKKFFNLEPISPYGYYGHTQRYIVVNYQTGPGTLVHELVHALMAPDFPTAPIWISEGLASLFEQCRVEDDRLLGEPNWRLPELQKAMIAGELVSLETLFSTDTKNFRLLNESLHYAQSRYFCLYLQELGLLDTVYQEFRRVAARDRFGIKTVEKVFDKPLFEIEQDWLAWLARQQWAKKIEE